MRKRTAPLSRLTPRQARERSGLSREELAVKAIVSFTSICRYEQEGRWPRALRTRVRYLHALGLTESDVMGPHP